MDQPRVAHHHIEPECQDAINEERGHLPAERTAERRHHKRCHRQHRERDQFPSLSEEISHASPTGRGCLF